MIHVHKRFRFSLLALLVLSNLLIVRPVPAPVFGFFDGVRRFIERSDTIIVARITATPYAIKRRRYNGRYDPSFGVSTGFHEDYELRNLRTIKGDLAVGQEYVVSLRSLELVCDGRPYRTISPESRSGLMRLIFLTKKPPFSPYRPEGEPAIAFSLNFQGAQYMLARGTDLFPDLEAPPQEVIEKIVRDSTTRFATQLDRDEAKKWERCFLESNKAEFLDCDDSIPAPRINI